jgi:hypothetical protein
VRATFPYGRQPNMQKRKKKKKKKDSNFRWLEVQADDGEQPSVVSSKSPPPQYARVPTNTCSTNNTSGPTRCFPRESKVLMMSFQEVAKIQREPLQEKAKSLSSHPCPDNPS